MYLCAQFHTEMRMENIHTLGSEIFFLQSRGIFEEMGHVAHAGPGRQLPCLPGEVLHVGDKL